MYIPMDSLMPRSSYTSSIALAYLCTYLPKTILGSLTNYVNDV